MIYRFIAVDAEGQTWTIPAESIESPFEEHEFVVHRSLLLDGPPWTVSHVETGTSVMLGDSKEEAISLALTKLRSVTSRQIEEVAQDALRRREAVVTAHANRTST